MEREMRCLMYFLLGLLLSFTVAGVSYADVTKVYREVYTGIVFAYEEDGVLRAKEGFESALSGYWPRNYEELDVLIKEGTQEYHDFMRPGFIVME